MIIGTKENPFRISFPCLAEPKSMEEGGKKKYSVQVVIEKGSEAEKQVIAAIDAAFAAGIKGGMFKEAIRKHPDFRGCVRDGDVEADCKEGREYLRGHIFFNASSAEKFRPKCVDNYARPVGIDDIEEVFYPGSYCVADINFYPFKFGKGGIAAGLNSIMWRKDGERLDGRDDSILASLADEAELTPEDNEDIPF